MTSISIVDKQPKIFGYLYVAVFSNGTVKAGRSARDPQGRVTTHANSGKAFDVHLDSAFYASIYTNDASAREKLMHQELGLLARLTTGKEWFKFEGATAAVNFASAYLRKVERMSFAERPSAEELAAREQAKKTHIASALLTLFPAAAPAVTLTDLASKEELKKMEYFLNECSLSATAFMALRIIQLEEKISDSGENFVLQTPILSEVIARHFEEFDLACHAYGKGDFSLAERIDGALGNGHTLDKSTAVQIIKTAAQYPAFFFEALRTDRPELFGEVAA